MADEQKKPEDVTPNEVAADAEAHLEDEQGERPATPEYQPGDEAERLPEAESPLEESITAGLAASEAAADSPPVEAFDEAVKGVMQAGEAVTEAPYHEGRHEHSDTVHNVPLLGTVTVPGGIYTVIFGGLALLTLLEVMLAELLPTEGFISGLKIVALLAIAIAKAALVVWFYMHLRTDSRLLLVVLILPLLIVLLSMLYLLGVPTTGYSL